MGIQTKLLGVLAVPVLVLVIAATSISIGAFGEARRANNIKTLAASTKTFASLVGDLQRERALSVRSFGRDYDAIRSRAQLPAVHAAVDADLAATGQLVADVNVAGLSGEARSAVQQMPEVAQSLLRTRAAVAAATVDRNSVGAAYSAVIAQNLDLLEKLAHGLGQDALGRRVKAFTELSQAAETAAQERDLGLSAIGAGVATAGQSARMIELATAQEASLANFAYDGTPAQARTLSQVFLDNLLIRDVFPEARGHFSAVGAAGVSSLSVARWQLSADERIDTMTKVASTVAADMAVAAAAAASAASRRAGQVLGTTSALVLLSIGLGVLLARAITRPIKLLTVVAGQVRDELPRMVERIAAPGAGPALSLPDIPISSHDEVGELAAAFRAVNETTVAVAAEQAALRGSIAEMFVNVARRNQVLLSRQLSFIDQLERGEENPAVLEDLFKLDHLATRMRRNSESLIVLAGIDSSRRMRQPMPLADVVRTAVSEIEHYERVDLSFGTDAAVLGHASLTMAHLLAELLENATQFSDPASRVLVTTERTEGGVRVIVTDAGLGMNPDDLAEANDKIHSAPVSELLGSQRLGLYVVGRLARRLDAQVDLQAARSRGVIATIDLPVAALLVEVASTPMLEPAPVHMPVSMPVVLPAVSPVVLPVALPAVVTPAVLIPELVQPEPAMLAEAMWDTRTEVEAAFAVTPTWDAPALDAPALPRRRPETPSVQPARWVSEDLPHDPLDDLTDDVPDDIAKLLVPAIESADPVIEPVVGPFAEPLIELVTEPVPESPAFRVAPFGPPSPTVDILPRRSTGRGLLRRARSADETAATDGLVRPVTLPTTHMQQEPLRRPQFVPDLEPFVIDATRRLEPATPAQQLADLVREGSYQPRSVTVQAPESLRRRTPAATPAVVLADAAPDAPHARPATEVRSLLSGYQDGVRRGRETSMADQESDEQEPLGNEPRSISAPDAQTMTGPTP